MGFEDADSNHASYMNYGTQVKNKNRYDPFVNDYHIPQLPGWE